MTARQFNWRAVSACRAGDGQAAGPPARKETATTLGPVAPLSILVTLVCWLLAFLTGYAMLQGAVSELGPVNAVREAGSSLFTLGFASSHVKLTVIDFWAAATGPIVIGLQVGYLPTIYNAYARRETEVTLLFARTGTPPWGPEILARYAQVQPHKLFEGQGTQSESGHLGPLPCGAFGIVERCGQM